MVDTHSYEAFPMAQWSHINWRAIYDVSLIIFVLSSPSPHFLFLLSGTESKSIITGRRGQERMNTRYGKMWTLKEIRESEQHEARSWIFSLFSMALGLPLSICEHDEYFISFACSLYAVWIGNKSVYIYCCYAYTRNSLQTHRKTKKKRKYTFFRSYPGSIPFISPLYMCIGRCGSAEVRFTNDWFG